MVMAVRTASSNLEWSCWFFNVHTDRLAGISILILEVGPEILHLGHALRRCPCPAGLRTATEKQGPRGEGEF